VKHIDRYLVPIILLVIAVSLIPVALELRRSAKASKASKATKVAKASEDG
jgi:hypothetical protein